MKVVFYTALFGGHDTLKEFDTGGYDFIAFTDTPIESKTWSVNVWRGGVPRGTPRERAKWFKMAPTVLSATGSVPPVDGDIVIWIDASITITDVRKMVAVCAAALAGVDVAFFKHPERDNIYDEVRASQALPKYADQPMESQVITYRDAGLPPGHGLYAGGVIARRYGKTKALDEAWWSENKRRTIQDQLSLPYVLWKLDITPGVIPGSVYGTDFHKHEWTGPTDKPQRRATDLCTCGATYDRHMNQLPDACDRFSPHPQPPTNTTTIGAVVGAVHTGSGDVNVTVEAVPEPIEAPAIVVSDGPLISVVTPTHNTKWLADCWKSLQSQTYMNFEWLVSVNHKTGRRTPLQQLEGEVRALAGGDSRVKVVQDAAPFASVGARKLSAFSAATGEVLVELDHDDILTPDALFEIAQAFEDPEIGFVYSDFADFVEGAPDLQGNQTYRAPTVRPGWVISGFSFYDAAIGGVRPGTYDCVRSRPPTALTLSHVYTAPNHVRAWRRSVYEAIEGHDPQYDVVDDHELLLRTYLATKFHHIEKPLYLYRITGENTWAQNVDKIKAVSYRLQDDYLERLVLRECGMLSAPAYDLGGGLYPRAGWTPVDGVPDKTMPNLFVADLTKRWPWKDGTVGAFRASDLLEHLPDKTHTMNEIHRCLRPGGWLMSMTPSALGAGAFMDPTHVSYWVPGSFWYYTRDNQAQYIRAKAVFREVQLDTKMIAVQGELVPYVRANIVKL